MSFINWPYYYFFFIKDDRSYLIFLENLLTVSSTPHSSNHFSKLEDTLNKTRLFNAVSFIKKSIISFMHSSSFIFKSNSWDSLGLTYLNQPKPYNLIKKYSKGGRGGRTLTPKSN